MNVDRRKGVWIDVEILVTTDAAIKVDDGKEQAWIPRSQIIDSEDELVEKTHTKIEAPEWLLKSKGLL